MVCLAEHASGFGGDESGDRARVGGRRQLPHDRVHPDAAGAARRSALPTAMFSCCCQRPCSHVAANGRVLMLLPTAADGCRRLPTNGRAVVLLRRLSLTAGSGVRIVYNSALACGFGTTGGLFGKVVGGLQGRASVPRHTTTRSHSLRVELPRRGDRHRVG